MESEDKVEKLVDITQPIKKPHCFDEVCQLINYYEEMKTIIEGLQKTNNSCLCVDENEMDEESNCYSLESEYSILFIEVLKQKMKEIRNILNYN